MCCELFTSVGVIQCDIISRQLPGENVQIHEKSLYSRCAVEDSQQLRLIASQRRDKVS
jgi:hypothetical protein